MSFESLLNKSCNIQLKTIIQDETGEKKESWIDLYVGIKCRVDQAGGGKIQIPTLIYEKATHTIFMRIINGFEFKPQEHRILEGKKIYEILLVADGGGHGNHWEVTVQKVI